MDLEKLGPNSIYVTVRQPTEALLCLLVYTVWIASHLDGAGVATRGGSLCQSPWCPEDTQRSLKNKTGSCSQGGVTVSLVPQDRLRSSLESGLRLRSGWGLGGGSLFLQTWHRVALRAGASVPIWAAQLRTGLLREARQPEVAAEKGAQKPISGQSWEPAGALYFLSQFGLRSPWLNQTTVSSDPITNLGADTKGVCGCD